MLASVARSATDISLRPGPKNSTNLPTIREWDFELSLQADEQDFLQIQCAGFCNHLILEGDITVLGNTPAYAVVIGQTNFADQHNAVRIEHLVVTNASTNVNAGGVQLNYLTDSEVWISGTTSGGSASIGGIALEQVQFSKIAGYGSAAGASAPALLIENSNSIGNTFVGFSYDIFTNTCVSVTSATATRNAWLAPYFGCTTALNGPTSGNKNYLIGATFGGTNMGPSSPGFSPIASAIPR